MKLPFIIAMRFLKSGIWQTVLIIVGIAVGISVQVFIGSLISGLQKDLVNTTIGSSSQITVSPGSDDNTIAEWQNMVATIRENENVINVSPTATLPAFLSGNDKSEPVVVRGFIAEDADLIYKYGDAVIEGVSPDREGQVIIGSDLQELMEIAVGEDVDIIIPDGTITTVSVTGIFDLKVSGINKSWLITGLETAQSVFGLGDEITAIEMQTEDIFNADLYGEEIAATLAENNIKVDNWIDNNQQLLSGLQGQSVSSTMIQVFVLIAVVLGIASVLAISVVQKSRQIGILKAMGLKNSDSSMVFLFQGLVLGFFGGLLGIALGLGLALSFTVFAVNPDGTPVVNLFIDYRFIAFSGLIAVVAATFAAAIPAIKSSKLDPMEVIRNG